LFGGGLKIDTPYSAESEMPKRGGKVWGRGSPLPSPLVALEGVGSTVRSPSVVLCGVPAENDAPL